jgi:UDP-3-O-[3-hydroxymyristoyl] glucosamine N-acyltransferase
LRAAARIHPTAIIGDDVIIGPEARVWEFTTVRGHTLIGAGASIGFNCEVTNAYVGVGSVLGTASASTAPCSARPSTCPRTSRSPPYTSLAT